MKKIVPFLQNWLKNMEDYTCSLSIGTYKPEQTNSVDQCQSSSKWCCRRWWHHTWVEEASGVVGCVSGGGASSLYHTIVSYLLCTGH